MSTIDAQKTNAASLEVIHQAVGRVFQRRREGEAVFDPHVEEPAFRRGDEQLVPDGRRHQEEAIGLTISKLCFEDALVV